MAVVSSEPATLRSRRQSITALLGPFKLPRSTRSIAASQHLGFLPPDLILEVAERLWPADILSLSVSSSYMRTVLMPALYETVVLRSSRHCRNTLKMLAARPDVCRLIKKLAVRPNYYLAWPRPNEAISEAWVASTIMQIAGGMSRLQTFDWDGLEMPTDQLWATLKAKCPQLRTVYTNIGQSPLDPESTLFDFDDLVSFSMTARHGLTGSTLFPTLEELPERMWEMLTVRCPNLEELSIASFSSSTRSFDIQPLTRASFPNLHTLTLGSFGYQGDFTLTTPYALGQFLSAHSGLRYLRLSWNFKRWLSPDTVPLFVPPPEDGSSSHPPVLPNLSTFVGIYQQLAELPNPELLVDLDLTCEPIYESRVIALCPILRRCTSLTSLDIWMHIPDERDLMVGETGIGVLKGLLGECSTLVDFHFICTAGFGAKALQEISSLLHLLPDLKTFSLTKGHKYLDEPMVESAMRIIRGNPTLHLQQVLIRWAKEKCPNHLKQEGTYEIHRGSDGEISDIIVGERGLTVFGTSFSRRYKSRYRRRAPATKSLSEEAVEDLSGWQGPVKRWRSRRNRRMSESCFSPDDLR